MKYQFTVIGNPIAHSRSPEIHLAFAQQCELDLSYTKTLAPLDGFNETVHSLIRQGFQGANVTVPFKTQAFQLANSHSPRALIAKAANTLQFLADGSIYADNTDGIGFIKDITQNHHYSLTSKKILILGAGGAVRGLLEPILQEKPSLLTIANRTINKAQALAEEFKPYGSIIIQPYGDLAPGYDLIIDSTSFDAWPLAINNDVLSGCSMVYDLKYSKALTPILLLAKEMKIKQQSDGFGMLIEQAAESFKLWTGQMPKTSNRGQRM